MTPVSTPSAVAYPSVTVGGNTWQFRYTKSSQFLLESWGYDLTPGAKLPALAWAAAMAGHVDAAGQFRTAGFRTPVEFTDTLGLEENLGPLYLAIAEALKKALPKATITLDAPPAKSADTEQKPS